MSGYITYTTGPGGSWIAWHTETRPADAATGRDLAASPGAVHFAIGPTAETALAKLQAEISSPPERGDRS